MEDRSETGQQVGKVIVAIALLALIVAYTWGVVTGGIDAGRRIDATHMVAIVVVGLFCTALLSPKLLSRIKTLELKGFKLELDKVREWQRRQELELEDIRLLIAVLLPDAERKHLTQLAAGGAEVVGSDQRRTEFRKLTSLGLVKRKPGRNIADLKDGLAMRTTELLEITPLGEQLVRRLADLDTQKADVGD